MAVVGMPTALVGLVKLVGIAADSDGLGSCEEGRSAGAIGQARVRREFD